MIASAIWEVFVSAQWRGTSSRRSGNSEGTEEAVRS